MNIETSLQAKPLKEVALGSIFSVFTSTGKLVRYMRTIYRDSRGLSPGMVAIGPYSDGEAFWYDSSSQDSRIVLDELAAITFHLPPPVTGTYESPHSNPKAGGIYIATDGTKWMGVRRESGKVVGSFVNLSTGEISTDLNYFDCAFVDRYQLVARNGPGQHMVVFDNGTLT